MKIAIYGISLNESSNVKRFMKVANEADLVLIVDTGSTDGTVELLKQYNAEVHSIKISPFRFDNARNTALALVSDEYDCLISLDLDELIEPQTGWRKAIENNWRGDINRLNYFYIYKHKPNGSSEIVFKANKIHNKQFKWIYPVHEVLSPINKDVKIKSKVLDSTQFQVHHWPNPLRDQKNYLPLLELSVKENPLDDRCIHYLAREHYAQKTWGKAIKIFQKHLSTSTWKAERAASMRFIAHCYVNLENKNLAEVWFLRACAEDPNKREHWIDLANLYFEIGFYEGCYAAAHRALRIPIAKRNFEHYLSDEYSWNEGPFDLMAISAWNLGYQEDAKNYIQKAVQLAPDDERIKKNAHLILKTDQNSIRYKVNKIKLYKKN